uniref:Uncharacterized protein n=1 Tax=Pipistrellus kuhlii TaxID=59472 RepID=A0A7J8A7W8_PIPKU|nr:hypothetical protein mPipKuh1_008828 [Pipistrellus kuhlii]
MKKRESNFIITVWGWPNNAKEAIHLKFYHKLPVLRLDSKAWFLSLFSRMDQNLTQSQGNQIAGEISSKIVTGFQFFSSFCELASPGISDYAVSKFSHLTYFLQARWNILRLSSDRWLGELSTAVTIFTEDRVKFLYINLIKPSFLLKSL